MSETLFDQLNAPFPYSDYEYDKDNDRVYIKGQAVAERLNRILGVGYWSYKPVEGTVKTVDTGRKNRQGEPIVTMTLLVEFSFYNKELEQWITFTDAGSQDLNKRMGHGDGTKSAITDGMKKCASRIGVASDLYKGKIGVKKDPKAPMGGWVVLPVSYKEYYEEKGWLGRFENPEQGQNHDNSNRPEKMVTDKQKEQIKVQSRKADMDDDVLIKVLRKHYKKQAVDDLTEKQAEHLIGKIEEHLKTLKQGKQKEAS